MRRTIKVNYQSGERQHEICLDAYGKMHGTSRSWYRNGCLMSEYNHKHGQLHGVQRKWYEDGQLAEESEFKYGVPHGILQEWDEMGQLVLELEYRNGRVVTPQTEATAEQHVNGRKI